ncbi:Diphosphoinositol polyphosphate phosphohydrolase aps1 [Erysiphe neolycopersici]|uniref:Diphosphoinositol polyphosphate phosphohydrolase aps1 n=1 Tax=Erysiphe neolycopersici TaxID=212602 RepID=A0A420I1F8_9PEZI|nr:Diphosphoinositol polyphosphate phosphohydrolase aps1 [Erysiphe neolycopersici]
MTGTQSMESRTGRSKQRYNEIGERLVAGVVPLNESKTQVLLIRSDTRSNWVLPKGGWELDESIIEAAKREAWEEAGIICSINHDLGEIKETRPPKHLKLAAPKALYQFFEVTVIREESEWPESHKRIRYWASYTEAREALRSRPELIDALDRSSIRK